MLKKSFYRFICLCVAAGFGITPNPAAAADAMTNPAYPALARVYHDMAAGGRIKIAFLGGSITAGACASDPLKTSWRALVSSHLETEFPDAHLRFIDAAIGGQPSKLAVFRMDRDVIPYQPDLVFVEYAVNDFDTPDSQETMEGIVRKLHSKCPNAAVVIVIIGSNYAYHTPAEPKHIELANYYGLPYISICAAVQDRVKQGLDTHRILADGCHPNDIGYQLYTDIVLANLTKYRQQTGTPPAFPAKPLTANRYETAEMLELAKLPDLGGWKVDPPSVVGTWFDQQPSRWQSSAIQSKADNTAMEFDLDCSVLGAYYETATGAGTLKLEADGKSILDIPTTMKWPNARVDFRVALLDAPGKKHLRLSTPTAGEGVKAAYLLYCR